MGVEAPAAHFAKGSVEFQAEPVSFCDKKE